MSQTELRRFQHELLYPDGTPALLFGTEDTGYLNLVPPAVSDDDGGLIGDADRPREDGRAFGEDFAGAQTISFEMGVLTDRGTNRYGDNADALERLRSIWYSKRFRNRAHTVGILRSNETGSGTYRAYGRPRRPEEAPSGLSVKGYTPLLAQFALIDARWYEDEYRHQSVGIYAAPNPGLIGPLVDPLTTARVETNTSAMTVGGTEPTWPIIVFHGPVTNPQVRIGDLIVGLRTTINDGQSVTVDPRPWERTVLRNDGANYAGRLSARTRTMSRMELDPGGYDIEYSGIDQTGTSYVSVYWANARSRPS